ncbi:HAMP domain-containing sensor histidine kinase [Alkalihalobacillus macyae]|uniref:sensor histidine kinase n=1 Tax=Guptibacillus hwajinpoensis TaxID=208199 RepID=UPI00273BAD1D|nr:HAMP domain-containing sensor histidine kinase [Alkalihalobacillus macyae]MDP4551141.1 HAMP domain-containing sensor histidine kinase [Alkalihalobacillus macyae]
MKRSIYLRSVVIYIGVVLISIILSFWIMNVFYIDTIRERLEKDITEVGRQTIALYENSSYADPSEFIANIPTFNYNLILYNESGKEVTPIDDGKWRISSEHIDKVLNGGVVRVNDRTASPPSQLNVGLPFQDSDSRYALFIRPDLSFEENTIKRVMLTTLLLVLIIGSTIFVILMRYVVRPIQRLTEATKKVAVGDFAVRINSKRQDEIGDLSRSFDHMAHDLSHLEEMRQEFVANVSHEIQSPLTSIGGYARVLQDSLLDEIERKKYLGIIQKETERLSKLSGNLLKMTTLDADDPMFHLRIYSLDEQLREVILSLEAMWAEKDIDVQLELKEVQIEADYDQLSQVWINLLSNSIRYTESNGVISIQLKEKAGEVSVEVRDTGCGIPEEDQVHVFDRFYKADKARSSNGGSGLGLAIVQRIVHLHQGNILLESKVGIGTTITITLPKMKKRKET